MIQGIAPMTFRGSGLRNKCNPDATDCSIAKQFRNTTKPYFYLNKTELIL